MTCLPVLLCIHIPRFSRREFFLWWTWTVSHRFHHFVDEPDVSLHRSGSDYLRSCMGMIIPQGLMKSELIMIKSDIVIFFPVLFLLKKIYSHWMGGSNMENKTAKTGYFYLNLTSPQQSSLICLYFCNSLPKKHVSSLIKLIILTRTK